MKQEHYLVSVKAEDRPGLLHLITGVLNRKLIPVISLTAAPTDIHAIVLFTIEIEISEKALGPLLHKLKNIVEVFAVEAVKKENVLCRRSAYFKLEKSILCSPQAAIIGKMNAEIINYDDDLITVSKSGSEAEILQLYSALDGPYLLGFCQTGLIVDTPLIVHEDHDRIIGLAA